MDAQQLKNEAVNSTATQIKALLEKTSEILKKQKEQGQSGLQNIKGGLVQLPPEGKAIVVGDIHGDLESLTRILEESRFLDRAEEDKVHLIFLGDYGDRGEDTPEVYFTLFKLKVMFPEKVILLRGNHEPPEGLGVHPFDLPRFLRKKYGKEGKKLLSQFSSFFNLLPHTVLVKEKYLMLHGGLPEGIKSIEDIANAHTTHPKTSYLEQILWSDPQDITGSFPSPRGAGKVFGYDVSKKILDVVGAKTLIRSHQPSEGASATHRGKVLTVFSRKGPPYYTKKAAYLDIDLSIPAQEAKALAKTACFF